MHRHSHTALLYVGMAAVSEPPHVVDAQQPEDVLKARSGLHVGRAVH